MYGTPVSPGGDAPVWGYPCPLPPCRHRSGLVVWCAVRLAAPSRQLPGQGHRGHATRVHRPQGDGQATP
jgi:hypothetical protein